MKLIRTNIADGETTVHTHDINRFEIRKNNGKLVYWYEDDLGEGSYPDALVTACTVVNGDVNITVDWDNEEEDDEEESDSYEDYGDIEMGFNPYMGCYDYDC